MENATLGSTECKKSDEYTQDSSLSKNQTLSYKLNYCNNLLP